MEKKKTNKNQLSAVTVLDKQLHNTYIIPNII